MADALRNDMGPPGTRCDDIGLVWRQSSRGRKQQRGEGSGRWRWRPSLNTLPFAGSAVRRHATV